MGMMGPYVRGCDGSCAHISEKLKYINALRNIVCRKDSDSELNKEDYNTVKLVIGFDPSYLRWSYWNSASSWSIKDFKKYSNIIFDEINGHHPEKLKIAKKNFNNLLKALKKAEQKRKDNPNKYRESDKNTRKKILDKLDKSGEELDDTLIEDQRRPKKKIRINDQRRSKRRLAQING